MLHTSLISDPTHSYTAVTMLRVMLIGTIGLAVFRIYSTLMSLPARPSDQRLREFFASPWWRTPALLIASGLAGTGVMFALQALAGNIGAGNRLGTLTPYLLLTYSAYWSVAFGIAMGAGFCQRRMQA